MTRRSKAIKKDGDGIGYVAEMSQALAARYGIKQGGFIKAWSRYGYIVIKADVIFAVASSLVGRVDSKHRPSVAPADTTS